jgi:hypothetical protein
VPEAEAAPESQMELSFLKFTRLLAPFLAAVGRLHSYAIYFTVETRHHLEQSCERIIRQTREAVSKHLLRRVSSLKRLQD